MQDLKSNRNISDHTKFPKVCYSYVKKYKVTMFLSCEWLKVYFYIRPKQKAECLKKIGHLLSQKNICKLQNVKSPWWGISDQINFFMSMINNRYHQYYHTWSIYTHMQISLPCLHLKKHICTRNIKRCNPKLSATYFFDIGSGVFTLICKYHYRIHI